MRGLFARLNNTGFELDISTFSKANLHRSQKPFQAIYQKLNKLVQNKAENKLHNKYAIYSIDSTVITLTSKLLWVLGHPERKTFLDKFRYLQSCMCQKISYFHWFEEMMLC
ncbi:hypothetical protein DSM107007_11060 [Nostoc sp. PCC 7120 = FACHB-418]|uniref:Transposase n=1 Tax=Trichormus variabilis NIES-23 TaxID=1973479 RepID=A0A1Z4KPB2_ANAVA|nr:hypothetical protein DSM107007_11060 [Nostoc sp. PCC 7120 = FACHB-418]BAB76903.1 transposase [Nostoc sp. PCC 7120 = FACHB-418]BAY70802.1 transposase [Trichormus variabilis NIES-23]